MAYNKFKKLEQLQQLSINERLATWLPESFTTPNVSNKLLDILSDAKAEHLGTEKAKSEFIITPVLQELRRNNANDFSIFSGYLFDVEAKDGLNGYCDYILSAQAQKSDIVAPIFCLVEAKNDNVEKGLAQCGAEMYAARLFNEKKGNPKKVIFGCVSTAFLWCFLKLEDNILHIDPNYIPLTFAEPHKVLAVLQWILDESLAQD